MQTPSPEEIALLPERQAARSASRASNYRTLLIYCLVFSALSLVAGVLWALGTLGTVYLEAAVLSLLGNVALFALRHEPFVERRFDVVVPLYAAVQLILPGLFLPGWVVGLGPILVLFALVVLILHPAEHLVLFGFQWLVLLMTSDQPGAAFPGQTGEMTAAVAAFLGLALFLSWFTQRIFLRQWRHLHARAVERERMREELESARRIQLGMLPQGNLDLPWIEVCAASVPATEVGGDYYDYFPLPDGRLAVVIADVAGHGLAPALLLSGVRSCLYLLEEELATPVAVLERLTRMVRRTSGRRTFVTLLAAVLDPAAGTVRVASAGHPPLLLWQGRTGIRELGLPAAALGTFVGAPYAEVESSVTPSDVLVLYTDGLIEARNGAGEEYGEERLSRRITASVHRSSAREIRDAVLSDLSRFRADGTQEDDFTLVVARLR
jgi:serine phosphatase RsbU (regulator of sigma subunit)